MGLTALLTMLVIAIVSLMQNKGAEDDKGIKLSSGIFKTSPVFNIGSFAILIVLAALYAMFW
jgi:SSS family solute:Na+ symporter